MIEDQNNGKDDTKDNTVKKSAKSKKKIKETKKNFFFDWVIPIFISIVLAICINKFLIFKVYIQVHPWYQH